MLSSTEGPGVNETQESEGTMRYLAEAFSGSVHFSSVIVSCGYIGTAGLSLLSAHCLRGAVASQQPSSPLSELRSSFYQIENSQLLHTFETEVGE